jgi:WD40 repeat protein/predicted Ser/Thr protein kinase
MKHSSASTNDSHFEDLLAQYFAAYDRSDEQELERLLASNPQFADRIKSLGQFDSALNQLLKPKMDLPSFQHSESSSVDGVELHDTSQTFPRMFGSFELIDVVGAGGMGIVYKAKQRRLRDRIVAIKVSQFVEASKTGKPTTFVSRFQTEIDVASRLDHPNIVPVYESGRHEGRHFIAMKLIEGSNLQAVPISYPTEEVLRMILIADAVQHAHDRGILHRDLKPSNIIVDESGTPYVSDFGLAKLLDRSHGVTRTGAEIGTPQYMSPEQAFGSNSLTVTTDVYSLGTILFERLCGSPLYDLGSGPEIVHRVRFGARPNLRLLMAKEIDRDLRTIVLKCLEFHPEDRYPSCRDFAEDLKRWMAGDSISARSASTFEKLIRWTNAHKWEVASSVAIAVALLFGIGMSIANSQTRYRNQITEYSNNVERARVELFERKPGWKERAVQSIEKAKSSKYVGAKNRELASMLANCDLGFDTSASTFHVQMKDVFKLRTHPFLPIMYLAKGRNESDGEQCHVRTVNLVDNSFSSHLDIHEPDSNGSTGIVDLNISSDGKWMSVFTRSSVLLVYSLDELRMPKLHDRISFEETRFVRIATSSKLGKIYIAGRRDSDRKWSIHAYDIDSRRIAGEFQIASDISGFVSAEDRDQLIVREQDSLSFLDFATMRTEFIIPTLPQHSGGEIAYQNDRVAVFSWYGIDVYDATLRQHVAHLEPPPGAYPTALLENLIQYSPDGRLIAAADNERNQVHVWSTSDFKYLQSIPFLPSKQRNCKFEFLSDGRLSLSGGDDADVLDIRDSSTACFTASTFPLSRMTVSPSRDFLYSICFDPHYMLNGFLRREPIAKETPSSLAHSSPLMELPTAFHSSMVVSNDGRRIAILKSNPHSPLACAIEDIDAIKLQTRSTTAFLGRVQGFAWADDSRSLFVSAQNSILRFEEDFSEPTSKWSRSDLVSALAGRNVFPILVPLEADHLLGGDEDGWIVELEWNDDPQLIDEKKVSNAPLRLATMNREKSLLAIGDGVGGICVLDVRSRCVLATIPSAHWASIAALEWTDSGMLVSGGHDQTLKFWKWDESRKLLEERLSIRLRGNARQVYSIPIGDSRTGQEDLLLLRESSHVVERLSVRKEWLE